MELINVLGRLQDMTVIGRSSSFQFKGKSVWTEPAPARSDRPKP